jgi:hypothetical protein
MLCIGPVEPFQTPVIGGANSRLRQIQRFRESPQRRLLEPLYVCGFQSVNTLKPAASLLRRGFASAILDLSG